MYDSQKVRELNDAFRTSFRDGRVMVTRTVANRPDVDDILVRIQTFDRFDRDNDPHGEHDFGAFEAGKDTIFWKIDCYSSDLSAGSEDPSDPAVTARVLTVMHCWEY
jgi:hypothetical protein